MILVTYALIAVSIVHLMSSAIVIEFHWFILCDKPDRGEVVASRGDRQT